MSIAMAHSPKGDSRAVDWCCSAGSARHARRSCAGLYARLRRDATGQRCMPALDPSPYLGPLRGPRPQGEGERAIAYELPGTARVPLSLQAKRRNPQIAAQLDGDCRVAPLFAM